MDDIVAAAPADYTHLTVAVVSAYVSKNSVRGADLAGLIAEVHTALATLTSPAAPAALEVEKATPTQIRKSITPDALISFIDGKPYKALKRHLSKHGLDIAAYRVRYGLPADYPTVSVNYSAARSALAKHAGLGQQRRGPTAAAAEPVKPAIETPPAKAARPGRRKKDAGPAAAK